MTRFAIGAALLALAACETAPVRRGPLGNDIFEEMELQDFPLDLQELRVRLRFPACPARLQAMDMNPGQTLGTGRAPIVFNKKLVLPEWKLHAPTMLIAYAQGEGQALGVPGDPVTAVMLGALIIQGVTPGPQLFTQNIELVYAIFALLIVINLIMFATGALGAPLFTQVLRIPEPLLIAMVLIVSTLGAYGVRGNMLDVWIALGAGVAGVFMRLAGMPVAPFVIGMVLSPMIEQSLRQGLVLTRGNFLAFFERPIALVLFLVTAGMLLWPLFRRWRTRG